jgi:predicted transposase
MFVSLQFKLELKREDKEKLIKLMRKQSSAIRVAYRRLLINLVQSLQSDLNSCEGADGRNSAWQVLRVALLFP